MSWLDADDDDDYDYDFDFLDVVSEYRPRGPTALPRRVFKVGGLAPSLSPLQPGPGSDLSPEAGLRPPTRHKARPLRDCEKRTHKGEEMYEVEQLRNFLFPRIYQFHTISNLFYDLSIKQIQDSHLQPDLATNEENEVSKLFVFCNEGCEDSLLNDAREKMSHQDSRSFATTHTRSKEKQECTRRSLKHKSLNSKLFEELPKDQFPFDWSKKNGVGLGGNKVQSYHNPLHGASATFIHRLTEIAGLECDTIRHEKIRKLKKRSDC